MKDTRDREPVDPARNRRREWLVGLAVLGLLTMGLLLACDSQQARELPLPSPVRGATGVPTATAPKKLAKKTPTAIPATPTPLPTPTPPAPLAALVNGQYVFLAEYEQQVAQYEQALLEAGLDAATEGGQQALAQAGQDVLQELIDGVLIEQAAGALGVALSDEDLAARIAADVEAGGGEAAFEEWLEATGATRQGYEQMVRRAVLAQEVWEAVTADVPPVAEQVHVRHIVVGSQEAADRLLTQLREGGDWATLVREQSLDGTTRDNGGDLGWFPRGVVAPELEKAAFALQVGGVSEALRLEGQYHILHLVEREAARPLSEEMWMQLKQATFDRWLEDLRAAALIERFVAK